MKEYKATGRKRGVEEKGGNDDCIGVELGLFGLFVEAVWRRVDRMNDAEEG